MSKSSETKDVIIDVKDKVDIVIEQTEKKIVDTFSCINCINYHNHLCTCEQTSHCSVCDESIDHLCDCVHAKVRLKCYE